MSEEATDSIDEHLLDEMRSKVLQKASDNQEKNLYDARDLLQVNENKWFLKRFLSDKNSNLEAAANAVDECLRWRKRVAVNDLRPDDFPREFYDVGFVSIGKDKKGRDVLFGRLVMNKVFNELYETLKQFTALLVEFLDKEANGKQFGVIFDMTGAGMSNVDFSHVRNVMTVLFGYYPLAVAYVCLVEPSWYFKPLIALIKALIPTKYENLLSTCDKKDVMHLIGEEFLPNFMGGKMRVSMARIKPLDPISFEELADSIQMSENKRRAFVDHFERTQEMIKRETIDL